jgi:hypothetical protein
MPCPTRFAHLHLFSIAHLTADGLFSWSEGTTGGVALRAPGPPPPRPVQPWKRQQPWRPTPARPSARMAAPTALASMDAPGHSSWPPFSRRRPQPLPTPTQIPRVVPRLIREGWSEGPLELRSCCATELLQRPVQQRWATTLLPMATCKAFMGTLRPTPSRRRSSATRTLNFSGSWPRIDDSSGSSATRSISTMVPTSMVGLVSMKTHDGVALCSLPLYDLPNG